MTDQEGSTHPFDALTPDVILDAVDSAGFVTDGRLMGLNSFENRVYQVGLEDTTPVVVMRFEADTDEALARIQAEFKAAILAVAPTVELPF